MPETLQNIVPVVVGGMLLLALLLFLLALRFFRLGRIEPYWRMRRTASQRGWRLFVIAITMSFLAAGVCVFTGFAQLVFQQATPAPAIEPTSLAQPPTQAPSNTPFIITATPEPTETNEAILATNATTTPTLNAEVVRSATADDLQTPTITTPAQTAVQNGAEDTSSPAATSTPTPEPTSSFVITPVETRITPNPNASLEITQIDTEITDTFTPLHPETRFAAGMTRIYFWVDYRVMTDGAAWVRLLLHNGEPIQGGAYLWAAGETGTNTFFFGNSEGFGPGEYEIQLLLGDTLVASASFAVEAADS